MNNFVFVVIICHYYYSSSTSIYLLLCFDCMFFINVSCFCFKVSMIKKGEETLDK